MKRLIFISSESCYRCHTLKPYIQRYCEDNGYELEEIKYEDYENKDAITTLPTLVVKGEVDKYLTDEDIVLFITNK